MDGRLSQIWDFRAKTRPTAHSVAFASMLNFFLLTSAMTILSCGNTKKFSSPDTCVGFQNVDGGLCSSVLRQLLTGPFTWVKDGKRRKVSVSVRRHGLHSCRHSAKQSHRMHACSKPPTTTCSYITITLDLHSQHLKVIFKSITYLSFCIST